MESPLRISYPPALCGNLKVSNEFPADCVYKIPFATVLLTICELGSFLIQSVSGDDYWIELWSFTLKQDGYVDAMILQSYISIALFLKGHIEGNLGDRRIISPAKTFNFFYLPKGTQRMNLVKGEYVILIIIPPQYYLKSMAIEHSGMKDILDRLLGNRENGRVLTNFPLPHRAMRIIKRMERTNKKGAALDFELRRCMLEILSLYNDQFKRHQTNHFVYATSKEKSIAVRNHILANLGDIHLGGLNDLALLFHITTKSLTKEFRTLTGKTIPQFIADERIEWARKLLKNKKMQVFEIAMIVGFSDTAHFIRKFKKKYGYSPGKWRNFKE